METTDKHYVMRYPDDAARLEKVLLHLKITAKTLSNQIQMSRPDTLYRTLRGQKPISRKTAERICAVHVEINSAWLLTGCGPMLADGSPETEVPVTQTRLASLQLRLQMAVEEIEFWKKKYQTQLELDTFKQK